MEVVPSESVISRAIRRHAKHGPDRPAVVSSHSAPLTYAGLQRLLDAAGRQLAEAGINRTDRIGISIPASRTAVLTMLAVACNAVAVPIDPRLGRHECHELVGRLRLKSVIGLRDSDSTLRHVAKDCGVPAIEAVETGEGELRLDAGRAPEGPRVRVDGAPGDTAFILATSGTTAKAKLVPLSHGNIIAAAERLRVWLRLTADDRCLSVASPYYSHGLTATVLAPLLTGGSVAVPDNPATVDVSEWFGRLEPTWYSATPTLHRYVLDLARHGGLRHTLRFILSGGMPLPADLRAQLQEAFGVPALDHYGSSETSQVACEPFPPAPGKPGSCGKPWPGAVVIASEDGSALAAGERGEILVAGDTVVSGYLDAGHETAAAFDGGYFHTGDIGSIDAEGLLTVHGRKKEMINRGGQKIAPLEIEQALLLHPAVSQAAAFPLQHPRLGEIVGAAVVLKSGTGASSTALRTFLQAHIAHFKIPNRIVFWQDDLPRGPSGKLLRGQIAECVASGSAASRKKRTRKAGSELEQQLLAIWRRLLRSEKIGVDDDFFDSGGDSLQAVEILAELERLLGRRVPSRILFGASTVRQLTDRLKHRSDASDGGVVRLHAAGGLPPLLFFHGDYEFDSPFFLARLARHLGPEQPIFGIPPHGLDGDPIPATIEAMAADRLAMVRQSQPKGPYRIGGFCNGAMVALEVARLLREAGESVDVVVLIDPPSASAHPVVEEILSRVRGVSAGAATAVWRWFVRAEKATLMSVPQMLQFLTAGLAAKPPAVLSRAAPERDANIPHVNVRRDRQYQAAMAQYHPQPLDVRAVYYAGAYNGAAWRRLIPALEIVRIPGGHYGGLTTHIDELARDLRPRLGLAAMVGARAGRPDQIQNIASRSPGETPVASRPPTASG